jgi:hypothetical protein
MEGRPKGRPLARRGLCDFLPELPAERVRAAAAPRGGGKRLSRKARQFLLANFATQLYLVNSNTRIMRPLALPAGVLRFGIDF